MGGLVGKCPSTVLLSRILAAIRRPIAQVFYARTRRRFLPKRVVLLDDLGRNRPSHDQDRAVLSVVKALAALDPAGCGLDGASAQLEGRTYVMAVEARPHFFVDPMRQRSYREDLVGALAHPSAVPPDAERCSQRS
jgi:hypothetical protein